LAEISVAVLKTTLSGQSTHGTGLGPRPESSPWESLLLWHVSSVRFRTPAHLARRHRPWPTLRMPIP